MRVFANLARRTSLPGLPRRRQPGPEGSSNGEQGHGASPPKTARHVPRGLGGAPPVNPVAVRGWIQDNLVRGIRRARAGERVAWLGPQLRSAGSPQARLLELEQRERIHGINLRRLQLLQLRATPPWQV